MKTLSAALSLVMLAGCVTANVYRSGTGTVYPPTKRDTVLVFFSAEEVKRPFEVIGEIMAEGSSGWGANDSSLVSKAQECWRPSGNAQI